MKKISIFVLLVMLMLSVTGQAFAVTTYEGDDSAKVNNAKVTVSTNELDAYLELKLQDEGKLKAWGYSQAEIEDIKSGALETQFRNELKRRKGLDDEVLEGMGYSDKDIEKMRSMTGEEPLAELQSIASKVTCKNTLKLHKYSKSAEKTTFIVGFEWEWDKIPFIGLKDCIGMSWNQNFSIDEHTGSYNKMSIRYWNVQDKNDITLKQYNLYEKQINAVEKQFEVSPNGTKYWSKAGYGTMKLTETGLVNNAKFSFAYAHNELGVTPSVNVPAGIGVSFSHAETVFRPKSIVSSQTATQS